MAQRHFRLHNVQVSESHCAGPQKNEGLADQKQRDSARDVGGTNCPENAGLVNAVLPCSRGL